MMIGSAHIYKLECGRSGSLINFCISSWMLHPSRSSCVSMSCDQYLGSRNSHLWSRAANALRSVTKGRLGDEKCVNIRSCQCQRRRPDEGPAAHWPDCWWWPLFVGGMKVYCCDAEKRKSGGGRRDCSGGMERRVGRGMFWERKEFARESAGLNDSSQTR